MKEGGVRSLQKSERSHEKGGGGEEDQGCDRPPCFPPPPGC